MANEYDAILGLIDDELRVHGVGGMRVMIRISSGGLFRRICRSGTEEGVWRSSRAMPCIIRGLWVWRGLFMGCFVFGGFGLLFKVLRKTTAAAKVL